jgi:hypothetical protein
LINFPKVSLAKQAIDENGFGVFHNVVDTQLIKILQEIWLRNFKKNKASKKFVRGNLFLGEKNFYSYSDIDEWCMHRHFDFLWNAPENQASRDLNLEIHKFRNSLQNFEPDYGLQFNQECYGIYISTSLYPSGSGMLKQHYDAHQDTPILHYMLPLTFKGEHYSGGGLYIKDKAGRWIDIDSKARIGSLIFFDGTMEHKVDKILSCSQDQPGRLAVFAIPTFFLKDSKFGVAKRSFKIFIEDNFKRPLKLYRRLKHSSSKTPSRYKSISGKAHNP